MRTHLCTAAALGIVIAGLALWAAPAPAADTCPTGKIYELRIYTTNPGKLDSLHKRFRDHTCKLFQKHGIELIGFWTPTTGDEAKSALYYIVAFPSVEAQKKAWQAFKEDPEWKKAKAASETNGVIVNKVESKTLKATDYSPIR
jgi:hypothetical protein